MRGEGGVDTHTYWGSEGGGNGIGEVEVGERVMILLYLI